MENGWEMAGLRSIPRSIASLTRVHYPAGAGTHAGIIA